MMYNIGVITTTRADYGLLSPLIKRIYESNQMELELIVSGTHLMEEFGYTKNEIEEDGFPIAVEIDWEKQGDSSYDVSCSMGTILNKFAEYVSKTSLDMVVILGDRFEMVAFASVLVNAKIPIAHINGGETTEGALDECYRHCLSKMSNLHFPNNDLHRNRIIQMGENPDSVINVGDLCVENILNTRFWNRKELEKYLDFSFDKKSNIIVTYHPVTKENNSIEQFEELLSAINKNPQFTYVFTKSNADEGGSIINERMEQFALEKKNVKVVSSLGMVRFLSLLKCSCMMLGNSSSGLYDAPILKIPTVNIGNRQQGRVSSDTVINCEPIEAEISCCMKRAISGEFQEAIIKTKCMFGEGNTSKQIVFYIERFLNHRTVHKTFYDLME